jgi:alpha-D-ribose 1-methylphosphonate 5-triphosphate synthase subunit PhnH
MTSDALLGGFVDIPVQSALAFRELLEVMARPGRIGTLAGAMPPAPVSVAAGVALLALTDSTTALHLAGAANSPAMRDWVAFHIGAPLVDAEQADFALGRWADLAPIARFRIGAPEYPDRSATLIVELDRLANDGPVLTGPGIETTAQLSLPEVAAFQANRARFPMGFDCFFTCGAQIAALPRSTHVKVL